MKLNESSWLPLAGAILAVTVTIAGCSATPQAETVPPENRASVVEPAAPVVTNSRGNVELAFGQTFTHGGATMRVDGAVFDAPCTNVEGNALPPEYGHFLFLDVYGEALPEATEDPLNSFGFTWIDDAGMNMNGVPATWATNVCLNLSEVFPLVGPGGKGAGKIVLDVSSLNGTLVYKHQVDQDFGFEWAITSG